MSKPRSTSRSRTRPPAASPGPPPELIVNPERDAPGGNPADHPAANPAANPGRDIGDDPSDDADRDAIYERAKQADYEIPRLQAMSMAELLAVAHDAGVDAAAGLTKPELIFQILRRKVTSQGLGWGEGTLDILPDGFGFLRSRRYNYMAGPDDIYVSPSQIRRLNLKQGHVLAGPVRPPKEGEKYFALLHVEAVDNRPVERLRGRIAFEDLTPVLPSERLQLGGPDCPEDVRLLDLLAPMGRGQRTLVLSPPHSGRNRLLLNLAQAILDGNDDVYVILLLLDERPEEVTEAALATGPDDRREVVATTFDEPAARHIALADMVVQKARRMVEAQRHVVLLVDSLTSLVRAQNIELPPSGKLLTAGLDAMALQEPKRLFGAARCVEEGGSLTVIATASTDTGSRSDGAIADEFRGKGNCEVVFDERLAGLHVYPPVDVFATGTRREDSLLPREQLERLRVLRKDIERPTLRASLDALLARVRTTPDNRTLLDAIALDDPAD